MKKEQKIDKKNLLNAFIKDEKGVYTMLMSGLSFILLGLMAVGFESSALLLDKARLSDTIEQASLALTAENNEKRTDAYKLADQTKIDERNKAIVMSYLEAYMPKANRARGEITPKDESSGYEIDITSYKIKQEIGYDLTVILPRTSIFPINIFDAQVIPDEIRMGMVAKAVKFKESTIPIDLMIVADFSTSMYSQLPNSSRTSKSKIDILKRVVNKLAEENLFKKEEEDGVKNENRIAITTFSFGGQQFGDDSNKCVIPFKFNDYGEDDFDDLIHEYTKPGRFNWGNYRYAQYLDHLKYYADDLELKDSVRSYGKNGVNSWTDYLNILYRMPSDRYGLKIRETVNQIKDFDGRKKSYDANFNKNVLCMRNNTNSDSISKTKNSNGEDTPWYNYDNRKKFTQFFGTDQFNGIKPGGSTLVSAGLLIGANAILNDPNKKAQRILLVLSDGDDAISSPDRPEEKDYGAMTDNLIYGKRDDGSPIRDDKNYAMCDKIRERMDSIVTLDKDDPKIPSKIAFVGFGTGDAKRKVWEYCVGVGNYFKANDEQQLLNSFKQAIGLPEEVGFSKDTLTEKQRKELEKAKKELEEKKKAEEEAKKSSL